MIDRKRIEQEMLEEVKRERPDCEIKVEQQDFYVVHDDFVAYMVYFYRGEPIEVGGEIRKRCGVRWKVRTSSSGGGGVVWDDFSVVPD